MTQDDQQITNLLAKQEIIELSSRYALAMDQVDRDAFAGVWAEDGVLLNESIDLNAEGVDAILAWFDGGVAKSVPATSPGGTLRLASNHVIDVDGDRATGQVEFIAFRFDQLVTLQPYSGGTYFDEYARIEGKWRITSRNMLVTTRMP